MIRNNHNTQYLYQLASVNLPSRIDGASVDMCKTHIIIDSSCIDDKKCKIIYKKRLEELQSRQENFYKACKNDLIICLKQNFIINELSAAIVEDEEILVTNNFAIITPNNNEYSRILLDAFHNDYVISQLKPLKFGRNYFEIDIREIENLLIPFKK